MAIIVTDPKSLPERDTPIPGSKPPITAIAYVDEPGHPEEADQFIELIRQIRNQTSSR